MDTDIARMDFHEVPGQRVGWLQIPHSTDRSAYGVIQVPIATIEGADGPHLLLLAGNHGDEYEGQVALSRLIRALDPREVRGRITVLPAANTPAVRMGLRNSPIDGGNLNRAFPGKPDGTPTQKLAHYIEHFLMSEADVVFDIHSGGSSMDYWPLASVHLAPEASSDLKRASIAALKAMNMQRAMILEADPRPGMSADSAKRQGCIFLSGEFGGAGTLERSRLEKTMDVVNRVLSHFGVIDPPYEEAADPHLLTLPSAGGYAWAEVAGLYVPNHALGARVSEGQIMGSIISPEHPLNAEVAVVAGADGILICQRHPARVEPGDFLFHLAQEADWPPY